MNREEFYSQFKPHRNGAGFQAIIPTKSGLELSIVAGYFYYSNPRQDLDSAEMYDKFEVAIFDNGGETWASYNTIDKAGIFAVIGHGEFSHVEDKDASGTGVFGWVHADDLLTIINNN